LVTEGRLFTGEITNAWHRNLRQFKKLSRAL
jgi:hypothetical protein